MIHRRDAEAEKGKNQNKRFSLRTLRLCGESELRDGGGDCLPTTQIDRPFRLKTPLGDDALLLESFQGYERISTPFRFLLQVLSTDAEYRPERPAAQAGGDDRRCLSDDAERHIHGHINRCKLSEYGDGRHGRL